MRATVRTKVCGVTREADLAAVADAGADAVGVIADVPVETPREVSTERAAALLDAAPPFLTTTLVTMPEDADAAVAVATAVGPDVLQVHGDLDAAALGRVREEARVRVVPVVGPDEPARARALAAAADALLVDTPSASGGGGTGRTHDWAATRALAADVSVPVIVAGGLTPENVAEAVRAVRPHAVDTASGVERAGGVKDHDAVAAFVRAARAAGADVDETAENGVGETAENGVDDPEHDGEAKRDGAADAHADGEVSPR